MHLSKRLASAAAVVVMAVIALYGSTFQTGGMEEAEGASRQGEVIHFWYADEALSHFINSAASSFQEKKGVSVIPLLVSDKEYLEAVNWASLHSDQAPDAYIISHNFLEKAYLAGLAWQIQDPEEICTLEHFPQAALSAVSCRDKLAGYPLFFDTSVLVCNETLLAKWAEQNDMEGWEMGIPHTVEDILELADTFDAPDGLEGIWKWDVTDVFYNYWFVGGYLTMGGEEGDDPGQVDLGNPRMIRCLEVYQKLNQFFSIEPDSVSYESVIEEFIQGRLVFAIACADVVRTLEKAHEEGRLDFDYSLAALPWVQEDLESRALSVTGVVAVNGYSGHRELADQFAAYLVQECAGQLYDRSGRPAANLAADKDNAMLGVLKAEYAESTPLPKMMAAGDFWMRLENLLSGVWNGGDVEVLAEEFAEEIREQTDAYLSNRGTH